MTGSTTLPITGIIHTKDSAFDIVEAVQSLSFCSEILVADMESQDETANLAQQAGATVISVPNFDFADPVRQTIIDQATQPWVFVLDADERVPQSLRAIIPELIADSSVAAYAIPRKNILFGVWLQHTGWWPDPQIRLFQKGSLKWPKTIHTQPIVTGLLQALPTNRSMAIEHYNYRSTTAFIERMNRYSTLELERTTLQKPEQALHKLMSEFISRGIAQQGYLDGKAGLSASLLQSVYAGVVAIKSWEAHKQECESEVNMSLFLQSLREIRRELAYWEADLHYKNSRGFKALWWQFRRKFRL